LGSQLVAISTVLALIARMFLTASRPMPLIATSSSATTAVILARMEWLASMTGILFCFERVDGSDPVEWRIKTGAMATRITLQACCALVNSILRRTTGDDRGAARIRRSRSSAHQAKRIGKEFRTAEIA